MWEEGLEQANEIHIGGMMRCKRKYQGRKMHTGRCIEIVLRRIRQTDKTVLNVVISSTGEGGQINLNVVTVFLTSFCVSFFFRIIDPKKKLTQKEDLLE